MKNSLKIRKEYVHQDIVSILNLIEKNMPDLSIVSVKIDEDESSYIFNFSPNSTGVKEYKQAILTKLKANNDLISDLDKLADGIVFGSIVKAYITLFNAILETSVSEYIYYNQDYIKKEDIEYLLQK